MTTQEVQEIYDRYGSIERTAEHFNMGRNRCYSFLKEHGVTMKPRVGRVAQDGIKARRRNHERKAAAGIRPGYAVRISCREMERPCVIYDQEGACERCRNPHAAWGIKSNMECVGVVR